MSLIWIVNILSVFFLCVFFAGIVIPQILLIAFRRRLFDEPDERKIHRVSGFFRWAGEDVKSIVLPV